MCIGVSTPPSKTPPPLFLAKLPLKSANCPNPLPFLRQSPPLYIDFLWPPSPKSITKFLVKISQFECQILMYFLCENWTPPLPPEKSHPLFPSNPFLKVEALSSPPFWKFGRRFNLLPAERGGGVYTMNICLISCIKLG